MVENHVTVPDPPEFCVIEIKNIWLSIAPVIANVTESLADDPENVKFCTLPLDTLNVLVPDDAEEDTVVLIGAVR
jgi:ribosome biogenesis SPOUT family RNA methylase Rps3